MEKAGHLTWPFDDPHILCAQVITAGSRRLPDLPVRQTGLGAERVSRSRESI